MTWIIYLILGGLLLSLIFNYNFFKKHQKVKGILKKSNKKYQNENSKLTQEKEEVERKIDEKSFKFLAINQVAKTLAKEKNVKTLKRLITDMLLEINSVEFGCSFENVGGQLVFFEKKNIQKIDSEFYLDKNKDSEIWNYLKENNIVELENLKKFEKLKPLIKELDHGFFLSFIVSNDIGEDEIEFAVVLGKKAFGEYSEGDSEFLETLAGQIEIILENSLKADYIERKNIELTEKVYDLMTLNYTAKMISSTLDLDEIFKNSIDMFTEVARAVKGCILYYKKETQTLELKAIRGNYEENLIGNEIEIMSDDAAFLKSQNSITLLTNIENIETNPIVHFYLKYKDFFKFLKAELFIPLVAKNELMGIILLGMRYSEEGYKETNIEVYSTLASQVAISIYNAKLYNLAITDGMTKLYLHRYFQTRLKEEIGRANRYKRSLSFLMTDIDHFKKFNDTYGHQTGDEVLKLVAQLIKLSTRESDVAARYGGEEFAIILPETGVDGAFIVAENLRKKIEEASLEFEGDQLKVKMSIGIYTYEPNDGLEEADGLIKKADQALYYSKKNGRNQSTHYNNMKETLENVEENNK